MLDELQLMAEEEVQAFHIYGNKYRALNPQPSKPSPIKQGWEFKAYLLVSIASVLLASMRTAEQFYRAAVFSSDAPLFGFLEAFLAVFTVEAGIVVYAAVMASRSRKVSPWVLTIGIILLAAISITAGLAQSLHLATDIDPQVTHYVEIALSLLIGPGASIAALIGGHILGQQIAMAAKQYEELISEYNELVIEYNLKLKKSWERSDERKTTKNNAANRAFMQERALEEAEMGAVFVAQPVAEEQQIAAFPGQLTTSVQPEIPAPAPVIVRPEPVAPITEPLRQVKMDMPSAAKVVRNIPQVTEVVQQEEKPAHNNGKNNGTMSRLDPAMVKQMQQAVTKWLLQNEKTPFDGNLNYQVMANEIGIEPKYVIKIIENMRVSYKGRK